MSLQSISPAGDLFPAVRELKGLNVAVLAGGSADAKLDVAAIRAADTILALIESAAGVLTDRTANTSITDIRAKGTLTLVSAIATDVAVVQGVTYTFSANGGVAHTAVAVGEDDTESAANLAAAINAVEQGPSGLNRFFATSALGVVTITARAEGAAGNAFTIASPDSTITASGATLAGGSDTGGVQCSDATTGDSLLLLWYNKR